MRPLPAIILNGALSPVLTLLLTLLRDSRARDDCLNSFAFIGKAPAEMAWRVLGRQMRMHLA